MKAQAVFEFMIAFIIFFAVILYTLNHLHSTVWMFSNEYYVNALETKALQISELLVTSPGIWESGFPKSPGLASKWPILNSTKIQWLNTSCTNNYQNILKSFEINSTKNGLKITITEIGNSKPLLDCGILPENKIHASMRRIALSETGKLLRLEVSVW